MRIKTDTGDCPADVAVPGSSQEREVFVIGNLVAESGACATHQLTVYDFSPDGTAGVIDVSFWDVDSADLVTRTGGDPTVLGTPATGGLALLYQSRH